MAEQANNLRQFVQKNRELARIVAVTSGKGGVGKTNTSVNLAIALADKGNRVVLLDADLGLANVEVLLGLNSIYNLQHVADGERTMAEILVKGPGGIAVVPGSSGMAKIADLSETARQNIMHGLEDLQNRSDFIIIDTMAGIGRSAVAFVVAADEVLLVSTPEPSSIVDAYAMLKTIYQRREHAIVRLVANMVVNKRQATYVYEKLSAVSQQYLGRKMSYLGMIPRDVHVSQAVMQSVPYSLRFPSAPASKAIKDIADRLISQRAASKGGAPGFLRRFAQTIGLDRSA
ncbi:MAG: MinD/ParA family protein [Candidatus Hydrogenedentota bacterium]